MTLAAMHLGSPRLAGPGGATPGGSATETPAYKKLVKAAQEFEGVLLSQLLGDFTQGLTLGGDAELAGSDTLNSLAVQTLAGALARQGVLGIAQMAVHQLAPSLQREQGSAGGVKD